MQTPPSAAAGDPVAMPTEMQLTGREPTPMFLPVTLQADTELLSSAEQLLREVESGVVTGFMMVALVEGREHTVSVHGKYINDFSAGVAALMRVLEIFGDQLPKNR